MAPVTSDLLISCRGRSGKLEPQRLTELNRLKTFREAKGPPPRLFLKLEPREPSHRTAATCRPAGADGGTAVRTRCTRGAGGVPGRGVLCGQQGSPSGIPDPPTPAPKLPASSTPAARLFYTCCPPPGPRLPATWSTAARHLVHRCNPETADVTRRPLM